MLNLCDSCFRMPQLFAFCLGIMLPCYLVNTLVLKPNDYQQPFEMKNTGFIALSITDVHEVKDLIDFAYFSRHTSAMCILFCMHIDMAQTLCLKYWKSCAVFILTFQQIERCWVFYLSNFHLLCCVHSWCSTCLYDCNPCIKVFIVNNNM